MFEELPVLVEALIFASELPIRVEEIQQALDAHLYQAIPKKNILQAIESLKTKYQSEGFSFELVAIAGGYQFLSKPIHEPLLGVWLRQRSHKKLTKAAMETLAVIAYQQPITKSELERVRGVNSDYAIQKLLEKELIEIRGRSADIGRPLLYGTNPKFMQHFGIQSIKDLPKLKEFKPETNEIGDKT